MNASESEHYGWLVKARAANQELLLDLLRFGAQHREALHCTDHDRTAFALFVGAGFSMWRAAFLTDTARTWSAILDDANKLLETLVRDNAINYLHDRWTREWMGGYYINNARWRLAYARENLAPYKPNPRSDSEDLTNLDRLHAGGIEATRARDSWDVLHAALVEMFGRLKASVENRQVADEQ